jgi:OOP family OmpA-OmpF porin
MSFLSFFPTGSQPITRKWMEHQPIKKEHLLTLALGVISATAMAAEDWDYAVNSSGTVWRNSSGECWHMSWRDENFKPLPDCGDAVAMAEPEPASVAEPEPAPAPAAVAAPVVVSFDNIVFENNSAELKAESKPVLDEVVGKINDNPDIKSITVVGHTDSNGAAAYNKDLSQRRAQSVVDYLQARGVTTPLTAKGMGEEKPIADNATREGRAQNRRVEFEVYK